MPKDGYYLPSRGLVSQQQSATIESARVPRSKFLNQWTRKTTFDADYLIPILVDEVLPGDHLTYDITAYIRMSTPLFPMFDGLRVDTFFFFVPNRLLWDSWVNFMGEQANPTDTINISVPTIVTAAGGEDIGSIYDHMGIPCFGQLAAAPDGTLGINALPFRAYNLIYNQWFRDENLQNSLPVLISGGDTNLDYEIVQRNKSQDYFTSALPWPQKFTAPTVPIGTSAPIRGMGVSGAQPQHTGSLSVQESFGGGVAQTYGAWAAGTDAAPNQLVAELDGGTGLPLIYADLALTTGVAINTLRQAWLVQQLLERDARGGTRYTEIIFSHFGVRSPDFRLQRAEYIGGGQSPLVITPIAQTAPTATEPLGALGGAGTAAGQHRASYASTEHGYIIGLINVRADLSYQEGLHKLWSRLTRYDFYWPSLSGLGEQAILNKEIHAVGLPGILEDDKVFGYQERWQEYRTRYSDVTGFMRSYAVGTLDAWHLAQSFGGVAPLLNGQFVTANTPMTRILAAGSAANNMQFLADILYRRTAVRPIPTYGTPVTLGRF